MYVYIYIYILYNTYTYIYIYTHTHTRIYVYIYIYIGLRSLLGCLVLRGKGRGASYSERQRVVGKAIDLSLYIYIIFKYR